MSVLLGVLLGLASFAGYGLSDYFGALASKRIGELPTLVVRGAFSLAMVLALFLAFYGYPNLNPFSLFQVAVTAALLALGLWAYYKGVRSGMVSIVSPIANSSTIVTLGLAMVFLRLPLTSLESITIPLIILGTILASFESNRQRLPTNSSNSITEGVVYALGAMLFWGVGTFLMIPLVNELGWFIPVFLVYPFIVAYSLASAAALRVKLTSIRPGLSNAALAGIMGATGFLAYGAGVSLGYAPILIVTGGAAPILTTVLALAVLKEKLATNLKVGVVLILGSLLLLSVQA